MFKRRSSIILTVFLWSWAGLAAAADWQCAVDLNGDGCACDADESSACVATDAGSQMCPLQMADCLPKYEPAQITSVPAQYIWRNWFELNARCRYGCTDTQSLDTTGDGAPDATYTTTDSPTTFDLTGFRGLADGLISPHMAAAGLTFADVRIKSDTEVYSSSRLCWFCGYTYTYGVLYERRYGPCEGGGTFNPLTDMCEGIPFCAQGELTADKKSCYLGHTLCPSGNNACIAVGGVNKCSPNACTDLAAVPPDTTNPTYPGYTGNGTVGSDGSCSGVILLFNGKGGECRPPGANTSYRDCCKYGGGDPSWLNFCKETESTAVQARDAGRSHFVEEYCKTRWKFGVGSICVQRARYYCLFNSKLGRIIQEQGRKQLKVFQPNGAWGDHNAPNCRGLSPQEFQMIDFSKADLSEFVSSINSTVSTAVQQQMNDSVNQFMNTLQ